MPTDGELGARAYGRLDPTCNMTHTTPFITLVCNANEYRTFSKSLTARQMISRTVVGVLALQGAFGEHFKLLDQAAQQISPGQNAEWQFIEVRTPKELDQCDALIIPGGESTTVALVAARSNLLEPLRNFVK